MIEIRLTEKIAVLTGAGISAESGIKTFRETGGLWETYSVEEVATPEGFARNPGLVWEFYNERRKDLKKVQPNTAHIALAKMEKLFGEKFFLVTQNVDDLHEKAGCEKVVHMHGELNKARCMDCGEVYFDDSKLSAEPKCRSCGGHLRPHVVWFGEMPFFMDEIYKNLYGCDWFMAIGTSGTVYPAAQFIEIAKASGARTICVNPDPAAKSPFADYFLCEKAGNALNELFEGVVR